ncbi:hypothetical protein [Leekyejoonella antrihumi]|uniref:Tetratricopeptide repeat protein n=1 Tax=Leekyejoonella antrihumi TaxID=1660198 RepID=A0A563E707_9MICO|nr:hypothetical protein [Leekyejoonella antrihumi]TWP38215.1 hypothetical protein FGL98_03025 [Leekyejoonella antrihumi]
MGTTPRRRRCGVVPAAQSAFLHGRLAFATGANEDAIAHLRKLVNGDDRLLEAESRLISGVLLAKAGALDPAKDHLGWVLRQTFLPASARKLDIF